MFVIRCEGLNNYIGYDKQNPEAIVSSVNKNNAMKFDTIDDAIDLLNTFPGETVDMDHDEISASIARRRGVELCVYEVTEF